MTSNRSAFALGIALSLLATPSLADDAAANAPPPVPPQAPPAAAQPSVEPAPSKPAPGPGAAYYEAVPPPPPPPPGAAALPPADETIHVAQPPLPPLQHRTRRYHDGFYLRLSMGLGAQWTSSASQIGYTETLNGLGAALDLLAGGTLGSVVLGGGLLTQEAFDPTHTVDYGQSVGVGSRSYGSVSYWTLGPFIDAFPNPTGGFHIGGLLGLAHVGVKDEAGKSPTGLGLSTWLGYMFWAESQWSVGGLIRFSAAWSGRKLGEDPNRFDVTDTTRALTFMISTAYH